MQISEEAVDALAVVLAKEELEWAETDGSTHHLETFLPASRRTAKHYLEAAAPHMLADKDAEIARLRAHILDIDAHATPYGDIPDDPGYVGVYLVSAGSLHRALGKIGHAAPSCEAEAKLAEAKSMALVEAAEAAEGMHDPVAPDCKEWADWLRARAAADRSQS